MPTFSVLEVEVPVGGLDPRRSGAYDAAGFCRRGISGSPGGDDKDKS